MRKKRQSLNPVAMQWIPTRTIITLRLELNETPTHPTRSQPAWKLDYRKESFCPMQDYPYAALWKNVFVELFARTLMLKCGKT